MKFQPAKRIRILALAAILLATIAALGGFYLYAGLNGFNVLLRRGGTIWTAISPNDPRISESMRIALRDNPPPAVAGPLEWVTHGEGFEAAELAVLADGKEVDRILLARIDPAKSVSRYAMLPPAPTSLAIG